VTPPVVVRQTIPTFTRPVSQRKTAVVELLVNEKGAVESASMLSPLDPYYDKAVVAAAKSWQYEPARADGKPVKYQKRVQITLVPTAAR
jgi:TonB family protein